MPDEHRGSADMPDALETAVVRRVAAPSLHAADIEMSVFPVEPQMLRAGTHRPAETLRGSLPDSADLLSADDPDAPRPEGGVEEITLSVQFRPGIAAQVGLPGT